MDRHAIAVTSTCRQINTEAFPILFSNLELRFAWYAGCTALAQTHPSIKEFVLPHLRYFTFKHFDFDLTVPVHELRSIASCLKVVDLGSMTISRRLSKSEMYDAAINKVLAWPSEATAVSSFNRHLMTITLSECFAAWDPPYHTTSHQLRPLLADKSRKFSLVGHVRGGCVDEQGKYITIVRTHRGERLVQI